MRVFCILQLFLLCQPPAEADRKRTPEGRAPEREVRAVWITTVAGLDWPSSRKASEQQASLAEMVERLHRSGFNTIFFQVRGRGDALYRSPLEPWSAVLTGSPGADPGWDPLAFLLTEAHRRGIDVHAWFNTYLVKGGKGVPRRTSPPHVMTEHPEWARRHADQWWLDPGEPGVERHLISVARDLVARYDVDGLQLDYLRYPGRDFDDGATYARYGKGTPRAEWRRGNITRLLERVRAALNEVDPLVKLGVTPIGIYRNPHGVRGLESFSDVFQDTYRWIERRLVDYIVPQLYWPIGGGNGDPDFAAMANEWREQTTGCHLYLGIGSYKDEVLLQSERLVEVARASGAEGHAFFRYANIAPELPFSAYETKVLPPVMTWKDSVPPGPPAGLSVTMVGEARHLAWSAPARGDEPGGYYAVYRMTGEKQHETRGERLLLIVPADVASAEDTVPAGSGAVWYAVTRVDRSWNESAPVVESPAQSAVVNPAELPPAGILRLGTPWKPAASRMFFLPFTLEERAMVNVTVRGSSGGDSLRVFREEKTAGGHVITLDLSLLGPGLYRCRVGAGGDVGEREIRIPR